MSDKYVLIEHLSSINSIICNIFQSTQKIKLTAFDVSQKYIVLGANSGGIYIFRRDPCQFLKLIPSSHRPIHFVAISECETNLAISAATGLVTIVKECFCDSFLLETYNEHQGSIVTALKWSGNEIYAGDSKGLVSVITMKNFLTPAIFQASSASLMQLDSEIVQLDTCGKFLLVSTYTRSFLCDTGTERYRQIGKKTRAGFYGACFFANPSFQHNGESPQTRKPFVTVEDNEELSLFDHNMIVYCARPGLRLWQVDGSGNVIYTHQFKGSLDKGHTNVMHMDGPNLKISKYADIKPDNVTFIKLFKFLNRFVVTFNEQGFYIFEPNTCGLCYWSTHINNIRDIKLLDSDLFIWHHDLDITVVSLENLESLILNQLLNKQYSICAELCIEFMGEFEELIAKSKKIHMVSILESKVSYELQQKLFPLIERLQECSIQPTIEYKNGITANNLIPETIKDIEIETKKPDPIWEQFRLYKIDKKLILPDFNNFLEAHTPNEIYLLLKEFNSKEEVSDIWCQEVFLRYLGNVQHNSNLSPEAHNFAYEAFCKINNTNSICEKCNFPLPKVHKQVPQFYDAGCLLFDKMCDPDFLKKVPYMYKMYLERNIESFKVSLPLIIQFSDLEIVKKSLDQITYDLWDESIQLFLKLKKGNCLNCGNSIDISGMFQLQDFALLAVNSINARNTLKLLTRYSAQIPKSELDGLFYQFCIFATVSDQKNQFITEVVSSEPAKNEFARSISNYLNKKYVNKLSNSQPKLDSPNCNHCDLSSKDAIIDNIQILKCGHRYHQVCFLFLNQQCALCKSLE